jgi:hypothetical protein
VSTASETFLLLHGDIGRRTGHRGYFAALFCNQYKDMVSKAFGAGLSVKHWGAWEVSKKMALEGRCREGDQMTISIHEHHRKHICLY